MAILHDLAAGAVWFATTASITFLLVYAKGGRDWNWAGNPIGRTIVALDLALLLLLIPGCVWTITGPNAFFSPRVWYAMVIADIYVVGLIAASRAVIWAKMYWWDSRP